MNLDKITNLAVKDWEKFVDAKPSINIRELDGVASHLTMFAAYLESRQMGSGHADALKHANRVNAKVRKLLGYHTTYPINV